MGSLFLPWAVEEDGDGGRMICSCMTEVCGYKRMRSRSLDLSLAFVFVIIGITLTQLIRNRSIILDSQFHLPHHTFSSSYLSRLTHTSVRPHIFLWKLCSMLTNKNFSQNASVRDMQAQDSALSLYQLRRIVQAANRS